MSTHLEEQVQTETPAVTPTPAPAPTAGASYTPSVTAADEYGKFLQTLANNKNIENKPTNAKSYADYLTYIGSDPVGEYNAKVRQANLEYAKGLATFGQVAEKMARSGLTGSGYGDYLHGLAYQGKQSAVGAAQQEAQEAMKQSFASYGDYLTGINSTNEQNAINGILSGLLEGKDAEDYAKAQGVVDDDRLKYVLSQTSANVSAAKAQQAKEQQAKIAEALSSVTTLMDTGRTLDEAIALMQGVYDADVIEKVRGNLQSFKSTGVGTEIDTATGVTDFKSGLDVMESSGDLAEGEYEKKLAAGSAKNMEFINALVNEGKTEGFADYINTLAETKKDGTVKKTGAEVWAEMSEDEKGKKITEWVDALYEQGNLTEEDYQSFFYDDEEKSLREDTDNAKELLGWIDNAATRLANGQISQQQYNSLVNAYASKVVDTVGEAANISGTFDSSVSNSIFEISYRQGAYGRDTITINVGKLDVVSGSGFVEGRSFAASDRGVGKRSSQTVTIGTLNGRVAYKIGDVYYQAKSGTPEYANTKHNAAFIAYMMAK